MCSRLTDCHEKLSSKRRTEGLEIIYEDYSLNNSDRPVVNISKLKVPPLPIILSINADPRSDPRAETNNKLILIITIKFTNRLSVSIIFLIIIEQKITRRHRINIFEIESILKVKQRKIKGNQMIEGDSFLI